MHSSPLLVQHVLNFIYEDFIKSNKEDSMQMATVLARHDAKFCSLGNVASQK